MKFKTAFAILLLFTAAAHAQEHLADTLRNGILEEDGKQNPAEAMKQYQAVLAQFAEARQTAATALFRMAECYRKLGQRNQAIAAYQRVIQDFADQTKLVDQSHAILAANFQVNNSGDKAKYQQVLDERRQEQGKMNEARSAYRRTILEEIDLIKKQIVIADQKYKAGVENTDEGNNLRLKLIQSQRELAAFDAGLSSPTNNRPR